MQISKYTLVTRRSFKALIPIALFLMFPTVVSGADSLVVVEDLRPTWVLNTGENWSPVSDPSSAKTIIVPCPTGSSESNLFLSIESREKLDIWINDQLFVAGTKSWQIELRKLGGETRSNQQFIQLTCKSGFENVRTTIVTLEKSKQSDLDSLQKRPDSGFQNVILIFILITLIIAGTFRRYFPLKFSQIAGWTPRLRRTGVEENLGGLFTIDNLFAILFSSFLASVIWVYYRFHTGSLGAAALEFIPFGGYVALGSLGIYSLKWIVTRLSASLFNFRNAYGAQFTEIINYSGVILLISFILLLLDLTFWNQSHWLIKHGLWAFLTFGVVFYQPWIYLRFSRILPNSKILIISYLCISEFLPGFLLLVWILR